MLECSKYKLWPISVAIRSGINVSFFGYRGMTLDSLTPRGYTPTEYTIISDRRHIGLLYIVRLL